MTFLVQGNQGGGGRLDIGRPNQTLGLVCGKNSTETEISRNYKKFQKYTRTFYFAITYVLAI